MEAKSVHIKSSGWRGMLMAYAPLVLWIGVIFFLSSGAGSMAQTSRIIRPILEFLFPSAPLETLLLYHGYIRKFAHFTEYFILGFLASRAATYGSLSALRKHWHLFSIFMFTAIAILDEFNQSFNPARTSSVWDIVIDCAGGFTAVPAFFLFKKYWPEKSS